jgi:YhcH/YjgK/YiaL family protein
MKSGFCKKSSLVLSLVLCAAMVTGIAAQQQRERGLARRMPCGAFVESLKNWNKYYSGPVWEKVFKALESVNAQTPDGTTEIQGQDIKMMVSSYKTKPAAEAVVESHKKYIDVQMVIAGTETFRWFPLAGLTVKTPYNAAKDVAFYQVPGEMLGHFNARPGFFAVFTPEDAHSTAIFAEGTSTPQAGRKVVVKVSLEALRASMGR